MHNIILYIRHNTTDHKVCVCVCAHHQTIHVEMLCNRTYPFLQCYFACVIFIHLSCFSGAIFLLNKKACQFQNICMCNQTLVTLPIHVVTHKHLHISSFCSITTNYRQHGHQWLSPTSMACHNQFAECWAPWPLRSPFGLFVVSSRSWSIRKTLSQRSRGKGWCTASPVASAHGHTLGR